MQLLGSEALQLMVLPRSSSKSIYSSNVLLKLEAISSKHFLAASSLFFSRFDSNAAVEPNSD